MIDRANDTYIDWLCYWNPKNNVIELKTQNVLCLSNEPISEVNYGDGGFSEE
ncbi:MAG: hypothetical protein KBS95_00945 [Alistipes sp.]|nr:hypothetical protein [Candidatus Alistipes equi]